jgi:CubicO group peptidase (beta-lactamase class C family)
MTTCQFAKQYLFSQIGITPEHWGRDPKGINSGGYNLYMTPREMSRFGLLYLNKGMWDGRQVIPRSTVAEAGTKLSQVDDTFAYSQGWWMRTIAGHMMYFGWGYGGQFLYVMPDLDIVLVTSENTSDNWKNVEINSGAFIKDYLIPAVTRP